MRTNPDLFVLDTNHVSALEWSGSVSEKLLLRLSLVPSSSVRVTIISYEEQVRGWMAEIARVKTAVKQVAVYQQLQDQLDTYSNLSILQFDAESAAIFDVLRKQHRRLSTPDLKIAAIALANNATLLTRNDRDFRDIDGLKSEDWTI